MAKKYKLKIKKADKSEKSVLNDIKKYFYISMGASAIALVLVVIIAVMLQTKGLLVGEAGGVIRPAPINPQDLVNQDALKSISKLSKSLQDQDAKKGLAFLAKIADCLDCEPCDNNCDSDDKIKKMPVLEKPQSYDICIDVDNDGFYDLDPNIKCNSEDGDGGDEPSYGRPVCVDTDKGIDAATAGSAYIKGSDGKISEIVKDKCEHSTGSTVGYHTEYYCEKGAVKSVTKKCADFGVGSACNGYNTACEPIGAGHCNTNADCSDGKPCIKGDCINPDTQLGCADYDWTNPKAVNAGEEIFKKSKVTLMYASLDYGISELYSSEVSSFSDDKYYGPLYQKFGYPFEDRCASKTELYEWYCSSTEDDSATASYYPSKAKAVWMKITCPAEAQYCNQGKCSTEEPPTLPTDYDVSGVNAVSGIDLG
ncbi:MAG: hypothetical protein ABIG89_01130 [Candidatus Woesearchaeota archaeon]